MYFEVSTGVQADEIAGTASYKLENDLGGGAKYFFNKFCYSYSNIVSEKLHIIQTKG